jgi:predicted nucleic acid-binding protein
VFHGRALEEWEKIGKAYLSLISITEISYFLIKNDIGVKSIIEEILNDPKIEVVENTLEDVYFAINNDPRRYYDFNDFLIISTAKMLNLNIFTFDGKNEKEV